MLAPIAAQAQSLPAPDSGTRPEIWFKAPVSGATVSGVLQLGSCYVKGRDVTRVAFSLGSTALNTDRNVADGMSCVLDTRKFADGAHQLVAMAYDSSGLSYREVISINIKNGTPSGGSTLPVPRTASAPSLWFKSPVNGATISGQRSLSTCYVNGAGVNRVQFFLDSTALNNDTAMSDGMSCVLDTTKFANGTHQLVAMGYNSAGASYREQISVNIQNSGSTPPPDPDPDDPGPGPGLPSTNTNAVPTFHSVGLYWKPGTSPGAAGCTVQYRKQGEAAWKNGLNMWYDGRNAECRGSLVHLTPGTGYDVRMGIGSTFKAGLTTKTWSEQFPIARTVHVPSSGSTLNITQGGSASTGYVLYTPAPGASATLDGRKAVNHNITISAPYVIVRGLTLKGAKQDAILLQPGAKDVVIEDNDISEWGSSSGNRSSEGWTIGVNAQSGISAYCRSNHFLERSIIQRNRIHHPTYGSNSWSDGHPAGPNAIMFIDCGGQHVIRHNEIYSTTGRYFMDAIGGGANFSNYGMPTSDSDIYGNRIQHVWDDAIESEGANRNVRIWGNYMDQTATGVATTVVAQGPAYIFRNVYNRSRMMSRRSLDQDIRNTFAKSGNNSGWGDGRRYVFHNTLLQATASGATYPLGAGGGINGAGSTQPLTNTVSRNNILHIWKEHHSSIDQKTGGRNNDLDYDLYNGQIIAGSGQEPRGIVGKPVYAPGHGWQSEANGNYQLAPYSPGYDRGVRLDNFNDAFAGAGPDIGAHEAGTSSMRFGRQ